MGTLVALIVGIFILSFITEVLKLVWRGFLQFLKIGIVISLFILLINSFTTLSDSDNDSGTVASICSRIDGCPIIDGVCIGCE
mgnify:CR=1 FL=1